MPLVVAEIFWHQNQIRQGMVLKMHVFLEPRYGIRVLDTEQLRKDIKNHQFDCNCRLCKRFFENLGSL